MINNEDRIQAFMDEVYTEWQKPENQRKNKHEVLENFSRSHKIAVVFGNFNYQVGNGGISQWIYNGYCEDDLEMIIEYLEKGLSLDEVRFEHILKTLKNLDTSEGNRNGYQRVTCYECGGTGSVDNRCYDDDDEEYDDCCDECGGSGRVDEFIGESIDCDAFDTWYYENCDDEKWWDLICKLIDNYDDLNSKRISFKPVCKLVGEDGNVFNLIGVVSRTLKQAGLRTEADSMKERVLVSKSYPEALGIMGEYVNIR